MPSITIKESVTKKIEIPMDALYELIDHLTEEECDQLLERLQSRTFRLITFKKDKIEAILKDFEATNLYEDDFLKDLEKGLKKSSVYRVA